MARLASCLSSSQGYLGHEDRKRQRFAGEILMERLPAKTSPIGGRQSFRLAATNVLLSRRQRTLAQLIVEVSLWPKGVGPGGVPVLGA